ncbi:hypothetical protein LT493_36205 [Streptomyces tricolor]|nr:hypothetical protein [Streptomyces tricolor]
MLIHLFRTAYAHERPRLFDVLRQRRTDKTQQHAEELLAAMRRHGSIEYATDLADRLAAEGIARFEEDLRIIPENEGKSRAATDRPLRHLKATVTTTTPPPPPADPTAAGPLTPTDHRAFAFLGQVNSSLRQCLCTLARHGVALRRDDPRTRPPPARHRPALAPLQGRPVPLRPDGVGGPHGRRRPPRP